MAHIKYRIPLTVFLLGALLLSLTSSASADTLAASQTSKSTDITQLSLEQLMDTEVTSASKIPQPISRTAAAIFVIDQEDIRRSTAKNIPELLRMVPGLEVARISAHSWAITARGFNGALANKLLVLIDGRSVYTPLHAGVYWDVQDVPLPDIERIEVIRGPGGSLWGSNAVNGVINIITKHTRDTQGILLNGGGGSERQQGLVRAGGAANEDLTYRAYGKYFHENSSYQGNDAWYQGRTGFRSDWHKDEKNDFTAEGNYYRGSEDIRSLRTLERAPYTNILNEDLSVEGSDVLLRWNHTFNDRSDGSLQTYFDQTSRAQTDLDEKRYTWDIEWEQRFLLGDRHEVVYGLGYRLQADTTEGDFEVGFSPGASETNLIQSFLQDTVTLVRDHLWLTGGVKVERNDYTGYEVQPTVRLLWNPHPKHTLWTSFSRAVRIPSRYEEDVQISGWLAPGSTLIRAYGDSTKEAENLLAYEAGYRVQPHPKISIDAAAFFNDYDNLSTLTPRDPFAENGHIVLPYYLDDQAKGETYGTEVSINTKVFEWWRFDTAYTFLQMQIHPAADAFRFGENAEGQSPEHQIYFRSLMNLPKNFEFDGNMRFVDRLSSTNPYVPSYWELDLRLGWRPVKELLVSVTGTNLIHNHHLEFPEGSVHQPQIERAVFAEATLAL